MQGVFTKILNLWIPNKTDKGTVVTDVFEPNFTKLDQYAEATNQTLEDLKSNKLDKGTYPGKASDLKKEIDTKLDKGTYPGKASDLKAEIDGKVSKSGDTITGVLTISESVYPEVIFNDIELAAVGYSVDGKSAYLRAARSTGLKIYEDNTATLQANNLNTKNKEVVAAINELVNKTNGLAGGYNGTFPLTSAIKDKIYLLPATNKFYVCIKNYSGSSLTAPNANFEELSVFQNRNKLENLFTVNNLNNKIIIKIKDVTVKHNEQVLFDEPFPNKCLGVFLTDYTGGGINKQAVSSGSITKTGFTFLTEAPVADFFMYFAIGY